MISPTWPAFADAISPSDDCNNGESIYKSPLDHSAAKHRDDAAAAQEHFSSFDLARQS